jgi:DNA topoisomerase-1
MQVAQMLFEGIKLNGEHVALITYPRADASRYAESFITKAKKMIVSSYGDEYFHKRDFSALKAKKQSKESAGNTQDAHESIRVIDPFLFPEKIRSLVKLDEYKLYKLI